MREILGRVDDCIMAMAVDLDRTFSRPAGVELTTPHWTSTNTQPDSPLVTPQPQACLLLSSQAGPPPTILIEAMSFPQIRPQLSLDTFKSHDNLVDPNVTAFTPNDRHKSVFLDTSVSLFFSQS